MVAEKEKARSVVIDEKPEWLFVCGRDVFRRSMVSVMGSTKSEACTLVANAHRECLGLGKIVRDIEHGEGTDDVVVRNIADVGDFLR
nr:hypothetical protein [Candidatus Njordarchaeum guaymaensis]